MKFYYSNIFLNFKELIFTFCCWVAAAAAAKFPANIDVGDVAAEATWAAANSCWFVTVAACCWFCCINGDWPIGEGWNKDDNPDHAGSSAS